VVNRRSVRINCRRCLSAAVSILSIELQRTYAMVTVDALEDAAVLDAGVRVMSHSCYCSLLPPKSLGTVVTNGFQDLHQGAAS
jgi:hypothetical protein